MIAGHIAIPGLSAISDRSASWRVLERLAFVVADILRDFTGK
jgi:hypothetical protein